MKVVDIKKFDIKEFEWIVEFFGELANHPINGEMKIGQIEDTYRRYKSSETDPVIAAKIQASLSLGRHMLSNSEKQKFLELTFSKASKIKLEDYFDGISMIEFKKFYLNSDHESRYLQNVKWFFTEPGGSSRRISGLNDFIITYHSEKDKLLRENRGDEDTKFRLKLRKMLEEDDRIAFRGTRRGRRYRHKETRPMLSDKICSLIAVESIRAAEGEIGWAGFYGRLKSAASGFHKFHEPGKNIALRATSSGGQYTVTMELPTVPHSPDQVLNLDLEAEHMHNYRGEFRTDLEEWIKNVYHDDWFTSSSSNIQRYMRENTELKQGSKRGRWIHRDNVHKAQPEGEAPGLVSAINQIESELNSIRITFEMSHTEMQTFAAYLKSKAEEQEKLFEVAAAAV
jgi:hypothetical protein